MENATAAVTAVVLMRCRALRPHFEYTERGEGAEDRVVIDHDLDRNKRQHTLGHTHTQTKNFRRKTSYSGIIYLEA